ncbi:MAG: 2-iminoacetate synthase ThiH [Nitrospinae bacterium]|nr:2-iminoacetate synthase ThiH [Nitrospinota bacterium]
MTLHSIINKQIISENDFKTIISDKSSEDIELLAQRSNQITEARFGKKIQLYVPLYLSNVCLNDCSYCGFRVSNKYERSRLSLEEAVEEAKLLHSYGFRHILLVAGEDRNYITIDYLKQLGNKLSTLYPSISIEIEPLKSEGYREMVSSGIEGVVSYQETYQKDIYQKVHLAGEKMDFQFRYDTADRAALNGMRRVGIGFLVGLADWRADAMELFRHLKNLINKHWQTDFTISFPRLRYAEGADKEMFKEFGGKSHAVSDKEYVQLITAFRIAFPDTGIVLSTRENEGFRNNLIRLGITNMSAGSKTEPGGYRQEQNKGKQFEVEDKRTPFEVAESIKKNGYEPVWKDWETFMK